ncbi:MAG: aldehyde dehydrogenase family protein [Phycisphaerales bacterium]
MGLHGKTERTAGAEIAGATLLINGKWCEASDTGHTDVLNPATGDVLAPIAVATEKDVAMAVTAAQSGAQAMAALPPHARFAILEAVARRIEAEVDRLAALLCAENGKRIEEVTGEVTVAARIFRGYAEEAKRLFGRAQPLGAIPGRERSLGITMHVPVGVIAVIVPFNYPVELWSHKIAGGLAAGNAVITKAPEDCPLAMIEIARFLEEAGLPDNAHQFLTGGRETGAALVRQKGLAMIAMTGSTAAGRAISEAAASNFTKVHLELGGNDATIVCADADVEEVADALVAGRLTSGNGQICVAVKRVLVDASVAGTLRAALEKRIGALNVGDPSDPATDVGPLINGRGAEGVADQIERAIKAGARLICGGTRDDNFIAPTLLAEVTTDNPVFHEEVFGPVLALTTFDSFEQALDMANDSVYGLQAALFTKDLGRVMQAYKVLDVGTVVVGHTTAVRVETLPFGGNGQSGNGREGIHDTLTEMTKVKTLLMHEVFPETE